MKSGKSSIPQAQSYKAIGEFWDIHDLGDFWEQTVPVEFDVDLRSEVTYYPLDSSLSERIRRIAAHRGVAPDTLVNLWVQENLLKEEAA